MSLNPTMEAAIAASAIRTFHAVQMELPAGSVRLIDGSGLVTFSINGTATTFTGEDPIAGSLSGLSSVSESIATEAPRVQITFMPPDAGGIADIGAVNAQGSSVSIWFGLVSNDTGLVLGQPELLFAGRLDTAKVTSTGTSRFVEVEVASVFDRLFMTSEGNRLNGGWHKKMWPGETGLDHVTSASTYPMWGIEAARQPSTVSTTANLQTFANGLFGK